MQRLTRFVVFSGALAVVWACSGDPTNNQGTPTTIVANPEVVFVAQGDSQPVIVSVADEDGQALEADFTATDVGSGITVVLDTAFLPVVSSGGVDRSARFFVKGDALTASQFTIQALGLTKIVKVTSIPPSLAATFSTTTPALGDTVTVTLPTGTFFTDSTVLTIGGGAPDTVSHDATTYVFVPGPNITDKPALFTNIGVTSNPSIVFSLSTTQTITTDSIPDIGAALSTNTPALGAPVTLTLPAGIRVVPESAQGLAIASAAVGGDVAMGVVVAPDSGSITFIPPPNADSFVVVPGVIAQRLPQYPLLLSTTAKVTTPVITDFPSSLNTTTPAVNAPVILTSTNGQFGVAADALVSVGADPSSIVTSVAGDGSSITFLPPPGASGAVSLDKVEVVGFPIPLPSTAPPLTVGTSVPAMGGTGATTTAPTIVIPATGSAAGFYDAGQFTGADITADGGSGAQYYKFILAGAADVTIGLTAQGAADTDADIVLCSDVTCSDGGDFTAAAAGSSTEVGTFTLEAGTYYVAVVLFAGTTPGSIGLKISQ